MDVYQERYLKHQKTKLDNMNKFVGEEKREYTNKEEEILMTFLKNRRSQRAFNKYNIKLEDIITIENAIKLSPSSCNRQAIYGVWATPDGIDQYLVGAKKWANKANSILLLFAAKEAYKSPNEIDFMPYLDGGFVGQTIYLICESLNIGACYVNPNLVKENKEEFNLLYGDDYFVGAFAIGNYNIKALSPNK